jgi:hypothetical protein
MSIKKIYLFYPLITLLFFCPNETLGSGLWRNYHQSFTYTHKQISLETKKQLEAQARQEKYEAEQNRIMELEKAAAYAEEERQRKLKIAQEEEARKKRQQAIDEEEARLKKLLAEKEVLAEEQKRREQAEEEEARKKKILAEQQNNLQESNNSEGTPREEEVSAPEVPSGYSTNVTYDFAPEEKIEVKTPKYIPAAHESLNFMNTYIDTEKQRFDKIKIVKEIIVNGGFEELKKLMMESFIQNAPATRNDSPTGNLNPSIGQIPTPRQKIPPGLLISPGLNNRTPGQLRLPGATPSLGNGNHNLTTINLGEILKRSKKKNEELEKKRLAELKEKELEKKKQMEMLRKKRELADRKRAMEIVQRNPSNSHALNHQSPSTGPNKINLPTVSISPPQSIGTSLPTTPQVDATSPLSPTQNSSGSNIRINAPSTIRISPQ